MSINQKMQFIILTVATYTLASDTTAVIQPTPTNWWENPGNIIAGAISLLTIISMLGAFLKKIISANDMEPRLEHVENEITSIKNSIDANYKDIKELMKALRLDLANKVNVTNYNDLVIEHEELEETVNVEIEKLKTALNQLSAIEIKLNDFKNHFDDTHTEHRQEIKEINETIKGLRENIRDDINDVKDIIMKLMLNINKVT